MQRTSAPLTIRPSQIDTKQVFLSAFGKSQAESAASGIIGLLVELGDTWQGFTYREYFLYTNTKKMSDNGEEWLAFLTERGHLILGGRMYTPTTSFLERVAPFVKM